MIVGRILIGALAGLALAVAFLVLVIVFSEAMIAQGWVGRYDDATMALIFQGILVGAPIVGGWKAWVTR